jgi:hypothetical protein
VTYSQSQVFGEPLGIPKEWKFVKLEVTAFHPSFLVVSGRKIGDEIQAHPIHHFYVDVEVGCSQVAPCTDFEELIEVDSLSIEYRSGFILMAEALKLLSKVTPYPHFDSFESHGVQLAGFKYIDASLIIRSPVLDVSLEPLCQPGGGNSCGEDGGK